MSIKYHFKKFDGIYYKGDEKIAIHRSGAIRLSTGFCAKTNIINNYKYAVFYFDEGSEAFAIKFTKGREKGAVKITADGTGGYLAAKTFFDFSGLDLKSIAGRYDWKKQTVEAVGEVYVINLGNI